MRQISLGINQPCSNCPHDQIIPEFYSTVNNYWDYSITLNNFDAHSDNGSFENHQKKYDIGAGNPEQKSNSRVGLLAVRQCCGSESIGSICFGPSGSGSESFGQRHGSGSGFFYHQAKIVRKTLIPTVL
jgi:hypothetical protein